MESSSAKNVDCQLWKKYRSCVGQHVYKLEGSRYCVLHFPNENKKDAFKKALHEKLEKKDFNFAGAFFPSGTAQFSGRAFSTVANFWEAVFKGDANFKKVTFEKQANFERVNFTGLADFSESEFKGNADLHRVTFAKGAGFTKTIFGGEADFRWTTFNGESGFEWDTNFRRVEFDEEVSFREARFCNNTTFREAKFRSFVKFEGTDGNATKHKNRVFSFDQDLRTQFRGIKVEHPERFYFHTVKLRPSWFVKTPEIHKCVFTDVEWYGVNNPNENLDEEMKALDPQRFPHPYSDLANACRELAINAEENREYSTANELHYWALSAERKTKTERSLVTKALEPYFKTLKPYFNKTQATLKKSNLINQVYWALSGYGDRPFRAFAWIVVVWIAFAILYTLLYFPQPQPQPLPQPQIADAQSAEVGLAPINFWQALAASLGVITLQVKTLGSSPTWAHFAVVIEGILGPLLIALLALALRRKFMR